jgi:hypothetical protein
MPTGAPDASHKGRHTQSTFRFNDTGFFLGIHGVLGWLQLVKYSEVAEVKLKSGPLTTGP